MTLIPDTDLHKTIESNIKLSVYVNKFVHVHMYLKANAILTL